MAANETKKMSAQQHEAKKKRKMIIFAVEIVIILVMMVVLYLVMSKTDSEPKRTELKREDLGIAPEVDEAIENETSPLRGYMNVALFGVDAETDSQLYRGSRSDSIMIASINMDTGDIKLVSVYRDTYLNIGNEYRKCNGGAEQAIKTLNSNLDLNIEKFVTVGYRGLSGVIDSLGGVYIDVDSEELKHINNYQINIAEALECEYTPVTETGYQLLNGLQATAYCRIRYTKGDDFKRTARQREVIKALEARAKEASLADLTKAFEACIDDIYTNFDNKDILDLLANVANYRIVDEGGFPDESLRTVGNIGAKGSCIVPLDLEANVVWLHNFLFDDADYKVTETVLENSKKINADTAQYVNK